MQINIHDYVMKIDEKTAWISKRLAQIQQFPIKDITAQSTLLSMEPLKDES